jgi:hypothetical protein
VTDAEQADYEERAAILEYDAGLSRAAAEREAWLMVLAQRSFQGLFHAK